MKINKQKITKISLIVIFAVLLLYVTIDLANKSKNSLMFYGYSLAIHELINIAETCEVFPVNLEDKSVYLINVACLQDNDIIQEHE